MNALTKSDDAVLHLMNRFTGLLAQLLMWISHYVYFRGTAGAVTFDVDYLDQAHGKITVRRNGASGHHDTVYFRVENRRALHPSRINGKTLHRIMTAALLEGFAPMEVIINNQPVAMWKGMSADRIFKGYGHSVPLRVATPAEAGRMDNPSRIVFHAP